MSGETRILGSLIGADLSGTADQEIAIDSASYVVTGVLVTDAPLNTTAASFALWTGPGRTGVRVVAGGIAAVANGDTTWNPASVVGHKLGNATLQFSISPAHGSGITGNVHVIGYDVP